MSSPLIIGDIFAKMVFLFSFISITLFFLLVVFALAVATQTDYMLCYSTYINNYNTSMETLLDAKKNNPAFLQFLQV